MAAAKNNTNAEVWSEDTTLELLNQIYDYVKVNECIFIGEVLVYFELYRELWSYWSEKFKDNKIVFQTIKKINTLIENNLFQKAANGKIKESISIFALKNNHKWVDKHEVETNATIKTETSKLTEDELKLELAKFTQIV